MTDKEIINAILAYVGDLDDPGIGWTGHSPSNTDLFKCERCGQENVDCSEIKHDENCSANILLQVLKKIK
jgi:hypothetical protein